MLLRDSPVPVFVSHVLLCDVRFVAARVRLVNLIRAGWLTPVSVAAWARGLAALPRFWMPRDTSPALARVHLLAPAAGAGIVTLPLRWETAGPVRVLNAGLTLMLVGPVQTVLRLDGVIRLPPTAAGHIRSKGGLVHRAAAACAGLLLADVADALASPALANLGDLGKGDGLAAG